MGPGGDPKDRTGETPVYESRNDWQPEYYDDAEPAGVFGRILRNLAVLVALCLGVAWVAGGFGGLDRTVAPRPAVERATVPERAAPPQPAARASDELIIPAGAGGHFTVQAESDGVGVRFLVDTGASSVILTVDDARRLGLNPRALEYDRSFQTANGVIHAASVTLPELRIGPLVVESVEATVADSPLAISLLGMSFLGRLEGYEVREDGLVLRW
jgi:aspartyl protease family protein